MAAQLSRSIFLEKDETGRLFYELFRMFPEQQKKKVEWKKSKKGKPRSKDSRKQKVECMVEVPPEIEVAGNASSFAVFATVRLAVLERWMKETCEHFHVSSVVGEDSEDESAQAQAVVPLPPIPKIVGVGLRSVFELVRESRVNHPLLCTKALAALLDVLQGHQPEALKNEPTQVVEPLLELLLDLATLHTGEDEASMCLTAVACSCLLALVTARGDTGKILSAVAALLMCPRPMANQTIQLPSILSSLQKSVHGVLLGKTTAPDWITHGIPLKSHLFSFTIDRHSAWDKVIEKTCASDGQYLYILTNKGLFKIGTGYGNTVRGYIYSHKKDFFNDKSVWMGMAHGKLLLVVARGGDRQDLMFVDRTSLQVKPLGQLDLPSPSPSLVFSDGDSLAVITPTKEDGFSMWGLSSNLAQLAPVSELPLKLVQKCLVAFGSSPFDDEASMHTINTGTDDEIVSIASGKEFSLIRTASGKVLYSGKGTALGLKGCVGGVGRWCELVVAKAPRITQVAVGHDSLHAVLLADDGSAYFTGTARRGEDADHNKVRRQPKAVKPKRMMKVESEVIVYAACNNGTTALVSREGQLFMFGKDTVHCDPTTGIVNDLKNVHVTQVALGKAHAVVITNKGHLYSFGINNKGQCGREFVLPMKEVMAMETTVEEEGGEEEEVEETGMCAPGTHKWKQELCMVCTVCRECTGYSISCLSSMRPDRYPGQECGCGEGDSGCSVCGCCRICARENLDNSEMAILGPSGASDIAGMMRLDLIFGGGRQGSRLQDHLQLRLEERKQRQRAKLSAKHSSLKMKTTARSSKTLFAKVSPNIPVSAPGPSLLAIEGAGGSGAGNIGNKEVLSEFERDASRVSSLPPSRIHLPTESPVIQVACGLHHTVCLVQSGEVFTFGSNSSGQLGVGDMGMRGGPVQVKIGLPVIQVAAGSNHTVLLTSNGMVYTFGSSQKKQLGRGGVGDKVRGGWQAAPAPVAWVGPRAGRRAAWASASSDQTYVSLDEALINSDSLLTTTVMANSTSIILVPRELEKEKEKNFHCLVINKRDGTCTSYKGKDQVDFRSSVTCLDSTYNVIFSIKRGKISCYSVVASEVGEGDHGWWILSPTLALPCQGGSVVSRSQAALHLLASLDTLASSTSTLHPPTTTAPLTHSHSKVYTRDDFSVVSRFESHGGGWGYSGHSIEAIRFMADTDILLGGFGLFGGRGEYTAKIKLFEIGVDGGEQENDGEVLAETEEIPYECGPRHKYPMLFDEPVHIQANKWYVAWARVSGPSSDCGSSGQGMVTTEDQVVFYFKSSKKSNNGTDVNAGQIPQLLYRVMNQEQQMPVRPVDHSEPFYVLSRQFSTTVTRDGLQSLLALLQWSWNSFKKGFLESSSIKVTQSFDYQVAIQEQERLIYIGKACLRLLRMYSNEIYPSQVPYRKQIVESVPLAECIGDIRALLRQILCDTSSLETIKPSIVNPYKGYVDDIVSECHETFVACYHAFYPTSSLKWTSLCDLLASVNKDKGGGVNELLTGMLSALRCRWVRLRSMFPILTPTPAPISSPSQTLPTVPTADLHHYPILVEQMTYRSHVEGGGAGSGWVLRDVVEKLLDIVTIPVKHHLTSTPVLYSHSLVHNASHLLARIIAELATYSTGISDEVEGCYGRVVHTSPSRFTRTNQSRTWNTGNGSPDAICFSVDRPGVVILGVAVYGGVGTYDYELELLDDQSCMSYDSAHVQRWNSLQSTRGSFGPDDCLTDDIAEIKFDYPVLLRENVKYAVRLRNHGGRTSNGDGGLSSVKGPDGVTFSFSTCSLSFNGTTQTRGQIPYIIYYSKPEESESENKGAVEAYARKVTLNMTGTIVSRCSEVLAVASQRMETSGSRRIGTEVARRGESSRRVDAPTAYSILAGSEVVLTLLPLVMAHISLLTTSDPRCAVQVLTLLQELLPHVSALNLSHVETHQAEAIAAPQPSTHRAWVESDHPYKQATVSHYKVVFPESVQWMSVEFSSECGTAQAEDSLQLYVPAPAHDAAQRYWPVLRRLSHNPDAWPHSAVILPGNEVVFSLETASDYVKDERANVYGFKCLVTGYEWGRQSGDGLQLLETEIAFLAGMCAASLIKKDLQLPVSSVEETEEELELVEETAREVYSRHPTLLGKGLALSAPLTITQALDGTLPYSCHSKERLFLRDFVQCVSGTSGGRLARWLQPESYVEPSLCQLHFASDQVRCGWPVTLTLVTKDQYDDTVHAPNLKVEIKAVPIDKKEMGSDGRRSVRRSFNQAELEENLISQMNPSLDIPYEVTHRDKMSYMAITMMKAYENYSFEELRYLCPSVKRCSENMLVKSNTDGTYNATWTPATVGYYSIITTIDGYNMREGSKVEVKEPPQGVTPPSSVQGATKKPTVQPSRLRRFVAKNSAGLRIRAHPSLQSEQIGIVHLNGTIAFIDEIENDDGVWLRLSQETIRQYCDAGRSDGEAWCLQFNQHLGKTLLMPIAETRCSAVSQQVTPKPSPTHRNLLLKKGLVYKVVKCGVSGHNVRKAPSLKAPAVGTLTHGYLVSITDLVVNKDGTWLQLDKDTLNKCLFNWEGDGWCLAMDSTNVYLRPESEKDTNETQNQKKKGYDFASGAWPHEPGSFLPLLPRPTSPLATPFVFGSTSHQAHVNTSKDEMRSVLREPPKSPAVSKWMKSDDAHSDKKSSNKDGSSDVSVRESSGTNGNGITPPDTPRKTSRSSSPQISTSSPLPIPGHPGRQRTKGSKNANTQDSISSSPLAYYGSSNKSAAHSPAVGGGEGGIRTINRCVKLGHSAESDTSALSISSLTLDSPQPSSLSSTPSTPRKNTNEQTNLADLEMGLRWQQTGTQTSPPQPAEGVTNAPSVAATFNIPEKPVPSPSPPSQTSKIRACEKEGMSPSMSESLRAIFASFLWHEGLVHDAMACASFLKFHPNLPKQGAQVVTRHTTHRIRTADQRHSVEVSTAGNYLHIKPSTLESLTRSAANANANRQRGSKRETPAIPEETRQKSPNREMEKSKDALEKSDPGPKLGDKEQETPLKASGSNESHIVMVLPPALKCLVQLWEQLNQTSLQAFATNSFVMSPSNGKDSKGRPKKRKEWKGTLKERLAVCELCGGVYPYPVTYHMRQAHAGCGGHAGGKGYNSGGNFCVGWAGNCGDGGVGGSSWYLVCDTCRDKYLKSKKPQLNTQQRNGQNKQPQQPQRKKGVTAAPPIVQITSKPPLTPSPSTSGLGEAHMVMKSNALFLLELSSGDVGVKKRSPPGAEDAAFIRTSGPFQSLAALGANPAALQELHFPIDHALFNSDYCDSVCINSMQDSRTEQVTTDTEGDASKNRSNFHRSISMGTNGWNKRDEGVSRLSLARKRNSSTCDLTNEGGSLLLWNPSAALQRLVPDQECQVDVLSRPVLAFLLEQHNLGSLRLAMSHALRKATCRVYAMQALDWLVHVVTQPTCLHDLLWWFVVALSPSHSPTPELPDPEAASKDPPPVSQHDHRKDDQEMLCEHPLSDMGLAGDGVHPLPHTFHSLLQSISHLMLLLPPGSALQQMAVRCWGINFTQQDHMFLHRSHVFSNISKILSRSEEEQEENAVSMLDSHISTHSQVVGGGSYVEALCDLTQGVEIKVSSRQAMIGSLTDNSTETFWESGDEDRNKTKSITLTCNQNSTPKMIYVHIDNSRDLANKVTSITFQSGPNPEELYKIRNAEIESRFTGWISCLVLDKWEGGVLRLELKGGDNSLRVRQIRVLGQTDGAPLRVARQFSTQTIQHCNTEAETLRVFRLITSQVFGKLIKGEGGSEETIAGDEETNDLKEHVVGILFSRSKLTHLQKQVCSHIVAAIRKESLAAREEWEIRLADFTESSGGNSQVARSPGASTPTDAVTDTYCFEMLSMVLALSGSSVGRLHLAQQHGLLADLMGLLHTGSPRVQRQVTALLRRMLPEVTPLMLAHILGVNQLPPTDFTIATTPTKSIVNLNDTKKQGILDVFLSCIAKALHVQVKTKTGKESKGLVTVTLASSIHLGDNVNTRWWLRGTVSRKLAEEIISLIKDMSAGKLSESWARVSKAAIAENIVNLTRLSEDLRTSTECLKSPSLWLALASLCVLEQDHVDRLSSGQWRHNIDGKPPPPRPTCTNHDDGETTAIIQCNVCGSLCAECDRYLHLHRRTRMHHRQVCKEEEEAIRVDLHEGCGRTKLFWALLVADSSTLKALVEFREAGRGVSSKPVGLNPGLCRFCGASGSSGLLSIGNVCPDQECQEHGANTCSKILSCGHLCGGIQDETECLPCLHGCSNDTSLKQDADDMCMICFVDALASAPALQLKCGHVFHLHCCRKVLAKKWAGPRITFSFSQCPICKSRMEHKVLNKLLQPIQDLFDDVRRKALMRLEYEGLDRSKPDPAAYAMDRYAYYVCFKCKKAYYGGEARCEAEARSEFDESELVCGACSDVSRAQMCPKHGADFLEYKCRYCCSVAVFFCFGTTHFCNPCHDDFQRVTNIPKNELPSCPAGPKAKQLEGDECPLHVKHPQTGEEFALGCGVCRNAHTF